MTQTHTPTSHELPAEPIDHAYDVRALAMTIASLVDNSDLARLAHMIVDKAATIVDMLEKQEREAPTRA